MSPIIGILLCGHDDGVLDHVPNELVLVLVQTKVSAHYTIRAALGSDFLVR